MVVFTHMSLPIGFRQHHRAILDPLARRRNRTGVRSYTGRRTSGRTAVAEDPSADGEKRKRRSHSCQPDEPLASLVTTNRIINIYDFLVVTIIIVYAVLHCLYSVGNDVYIYVYIYIHGYFLRHWPFVCVCVCGGGGGGGEPIGHRWIPLTTASDAELWWFLWSAPD